MAFDLQKLKDKLGDDFAALQSHVDDLTGQRDAARKESQEQRQGLKKRVTDLEAWQAKALEKLALDDAEGIDALPDAKGQAEAAKQFERQVKALQKQVADVSAERDKITGDLRTSKLESQLAAEVAKHNFVDPAVMSELFRSRAKFEGDEASVTVEGKPLSVAEAVATFAAKNTHLIKAAGTGGSGKPNGGAGGVPGKSMTRAAFEALPPQDRAAAMKERVALVEH